MARPPVSRRSGFKELQDHWYKKLKESGFEDIEDTNSPYESLKRWDAHYFQARYTPDAFEQKDQYYSMALEFLHTHEFETPRERQIWELSAERGYSLREISKELKITIYQAREVILKLDRIMKLQFLDWSTGMGMPLFYVTKPRI